ncbi:GldM family protein [Flavobacterium lacisediminis]|uniref:GldM family protein n=1 Tax=Flavobacterium lacisediminis TaxID=2989705 RepID=A0ABT3EEC8_9FLAO|nr:GldM family protein [Flavobacterium lacisediminis]MCW1146931.1 GldM family protein [Flavobacterium lacisediminis]
MKKLLLFVFIISFHSYAQDTIPASKSIIALDKMNVVYRGVPNPISIAVNNAKSYVIYGNGVFKNEEGKYVIRPGSGSETKVFVEIENFDGSKVIEEHVFRIKGLPSGFVTINSLGCYKNCIVELTKEEFQNAFLSYHMPDFVFNFKVNVIGFTISFIDSDNKILDKTIEVKGNRIDEQTYSEIFKTKGFTFLKIHEFQIEFDEGLDLYICKISPLKITIVK